jgi:hypothetical protein
VIWSAPSPLRLPAHSKRATISRREFPAIAIVAPFVILKLRTTKADGEAIGFRIEHISATRDDSIAIEMRAGSGFVASFAIRDRALKVHH